MSKLIESSIEQYAIELLKSLGYQYLGPKEQEAERKSLSDVVLVDRLKKAIDRINYSMTADMKLQALKAMMNLGSQDLISNNEVLHEILINGVSTVTMIMGESRGNRVQLIGFEDPRNNELY